MLALTEFIATLKWQSLRLQLLVDFLNFLFSDFDFLPERFEHCGVEWFPPTVAAQLQRILHHALGLIANQRGEVLTRRVCSKRFFVRRLGAEDRAEVVQV